MRIKDEPSPTFFLFLRPEKREEDESTPLFSPLSLPPRHSSASPPMQYFFVGASISFPFPFFPPGGQIMRNSRHFPFSLPLFFFFGVSVVRAFSPLSFSGIDKQQIDLSLPVFFFSFFFFFVAFISPQFCAYPDGTSVEGEVLSLFPFFFSVVDKKKIPVLPLFFSFLLISSFPVSP